MEVEPGELHLEEHPGAAGPKRARPLLGALPKERFGSASAVHKRFLEWEKAGFFEALWQAGLAEYDQMEGVAWRWQSIDGALLKAPMAQQAVGPNPTDRGKKWKQATPAGRRAWRPVVDHRDRGQRQ